MDHATRSSRQLCPTNGSTSKVVSAGASVPPGDYRTQSCLDHTVALLLMELVQNL